MWEVSWLKNYLRVKDSASWICLFIYLPLCMAHFQVLKRRERVDGENKEKVRQKEVWRGGGRSKGRKGWTRERISAWRMEEKHKNQRKEIKKRGNQFAHMRCTPIMFRFLTRKRGFSLFQSVLTSFGISAAQYSVANECSFVGGKMAGHKAENSPPI